MKNTLFLLAASMLIAFAAQSQIIYTDINPDQTCNTNNCTYNLDLNNDGVTDFTIYETIPQAICDSHKNHDVQVTPTSGDAIVNSSPFGPPSELLAGDTINSLMIFLNTSAEFLADSIWVSIFGSPCNNVRGGNWVNGATNKFLGLWITQGGNYYYGWARLDVERDALSFTIKDYAYNSIPNKPILAGQKCNPLPSAADATITAGGSTTFCLGGNVLLTDAGEGFGYQWENGGIDISGATNQSYTATQGGNYTCDVSNSCGVTVSNLITVTVNNPPSSSQVAITAAGPTSWCDNAGSVTLTVAASGLTYHWKKNGTVIPGETSQSYSASAIGNYACNVSNSCGTTISNSIKLSVYTAPPSAAQSHITGPTAFCSGGNLTLSVAAAGLTYHWRRNGASISGATNQTYTVKKAATYTCDVGNACGTTTSNSIVVTENPKPKITFTTIQCSNENLIMTVKTSPPIGVTYQWWKQGPEIISGATDSTYIATEHTTYWCVVTIIATGCSQKSGQVVFSSCKEISGEPDYATLFKIYPNPSNGVFNLQFQSQDESATNATVEIRNDLEQMVFQKNYSLNSGELQEQIDLGSLRAGVYNVIVHAGAQMTMRTIVIQ